MRRATSGHQKNGRRKSAATVALLAIALILVLGLPFPSSRAQSGVLIPAPKEKPDASILSLQVMNVDVLIDNQHATVRVLQIYDNHTAQTLEGKYLFALPPLASVSDFAVWDGDTRIPGVMMEKRRANAIYGEIKQATVDPGLLQQDDEHEGQSAFSAKVFPINPYGSKRVEMEYTEMLPVEGLASHFTFPLKPSFGDAQRVREFNLHIHVLGDYPITVSDSGQTIYPLNVLKSQPNEFEGEFDAREIELKDDFSFDYGINVPHSLLSFIAYRAPERISPYDLRDPSLAARNPDGYFEARAIFNEQGNTETGQAAQSPSTGESHTQPRNVILLLDTSLSMYGEKLTRAVESVDYFLHGLTPQDHFNLILFNEETSFFSPAPVEATSDKVEEALQFIKGYSLGGATDLRKALEQALYAARNFPAGERNIILVSDANPTLGTTSTKQITRLFDVGKKQDGKERTRLFAFALGSDANDALLEELAKKTHGYFARARETEDISAMLKIFFSKVSLPGIENLRLTSSDPTNFYQVYATGENSFDGSSFGFVGRYKRSEAQTMLNLSGQYGAASINLSRSVQLPEFEDTHQHLPRLWARARVDALLEEMNLNGEREDYIAEIIRLSQKYRFVTPYTAFLAAPRALLRPRLIQPGDPVIRVKTDAAITSVFAVLPYGETLPLKFLQAEGVWETRFFAPSWMPDGTYRCRLLMTDRNGNGYQEEKSFVVDSHAPRLKVRLATETVRAGDELQLRVDADSDTARLVAKFYGARPTQLFWSQKDKTNTGRLRVPAGLAAGQYTLTVTAEDFAHNQSTSEVRIEVIGR
ncbi:MAG: Ca-activated chloride channel [Acidobacteriota bacterium]|jgi:Ca-activated chloride channel family protein|nr:Ca-activated chloride channel [Acidobacteriota bacterium]